MKVNQKPFNYDQDFLQVRDFLSNTYRFYQRSVNWRIERWEYAFHFIAPYFSAWFNPAPSQEQVEQTIRYLENLTGVWKTTDGEIAGVVNIEHPELAHPDFGEFFIQRHPDHIDLFPEMLDFAEANLRDPGQNRLFTYISPDDQPLRDLLEERGFIAFTDDTEEESLMDVAKTSLHDEPSLPEGFRIQSMADDNDLAKRCKAFGRGFNHPEPDDWPPVIAYEYLQRAPDYRKDQDIVVVAPDGEFASFCLIWHDDPNHLAILEPVGTQPEYRRLGLAREAIFEAIRRVSAKGAKYIIVGSGGGFYEAIGFKPVRSLIRFQKYYQ